MSRPSRIDNRPELGELVLHRDGQPSLHLRHHDLRQACLCAFCRAERLRGREVQADADIRVIAVRPMGYGVQLVFSDGHDRGIYPWSLLAELVDEQPKEPRSAT